MGKFVDLTGKKFSRLLVVERVDDKVFKDGSKIPQWKCKCDCGNYVIRRTQSLVEGSSKSCGCLRGEIGNKNFVFEVGKIIKLKHGSFEVLEQKRCVRDFEKIKDKKYICKCVNCGEINEISEHSLLSNIGSCKACSDTRSFGERYFYWFLKQTGVDFKTEYSPSWMKRKRFDFYFKYNDDNVIVEIDGSQHYNRSHKRLTCEEVKEIDEYKQKVAESKGFKVIRIKCEKSIKESIVESIINSDLQNYFDFSNMDWEKCFYMSMSSKQRKACELWNEGINSTKKISEILGINQNYVSKLLTQCSNSGFCDYNPKEEMEKGAKCSTNGKKLICKNNGKVYDSTSECSRRSLEDFGIFLKGSSIARVCRKERESYKGFRFEYLNN